MAALIPTDKPLRIVQLSNDWITLPPARYGGAERVSYALTEELVRRGHDVYLFAKRGSKTSAKLIPYDSVHTRHMDVPRVLGEFIKSHLPEQVDLVHDHIASIAELRLLSVPTVCTIHYKNLSETIEYPIYVSKRSMKACGNRGCYVHNGLILSDYQFNEIKDDYLLFMGSVGRLKGIHFALDAAEQAGLPLIIAGPIHGSRYFYEEIEPRMKSNPKVSYLGEVGGQKRQDLLKHARCFLFPTNNEEAFGLVMIEAMACGTPVLALNNGAVSEVLHGFPQLVCQSVEEMVEKIRADVYPSPYSLREYVSMHYTDKIMTDHYLEIYRNVLANSAQ